MLRENPRTNRYDLICQVLQKSLGYIPLPLIIAINRDYRRLIATIKMYIENGCLEPFLTDNQSDLQGFLFLLQRSLAKKGELKISEYKGYSFKILSFQEMTKGSVLPVFVIADHLLCPNSPIRIRRETGYKYPTVIHCLASLKRMGLLEKEDGQYILRGTQEKLHEFLKNSGQCKLRQVERIRLYIKVMEMTAKDFSRKEIVLKTGASRKKIVPWQLGGKQPKLRLETAELFVKQGFISDVELEIWKKIGVLKTTKGE